MCDLQEMLNRIKKEKKKKGYTNEVLGAETKIPKSTLDKILSGAIKEPPVTSIIKIAKVLDVTTDYLIYGDNNADSKKNLFYNKYDMLNDFGKAKAESYINDLLVNPQYQNKAQFQKESSYSIAAWGGDETETTQPPIDEITT